MKLIRLVFDYPCRARIRRCSRGVNLAKSKTTLVRFALFMAVFDAYLTFWQTVVFRTPVYRCASVEPGPLPVTLWLVLYGIRGFFLSEATIKLLSTSLQPTVLSNPSLTGSSFSTPRRLGSRTPASARALPLQILGVVDRIG